MPLTCVLVVAREVPAAQQQLDFVVSSVSVFLDPSANIPFWRACAFGSTHFAQLVWDSCDEAEKRCENHAKWKLAASADKNVGLNRKRPWCPWGDQFKQLREACDAWTFAASLKSDPHYHNYQFSKGCLEAAKRNDVELLKWIFSHFSSGTVSMEVLEEAARRGHKEVLQFLQEYYVAHRGESDEEESKCHDIPGFSFAPLNAALQAGQKELALWMAGKSCFDSMEGIVELLKNLAQYTDLEFLLKSWPKLKYLSCGRKHPPFPPRLDYAAEGGDINLADWILDQGKDSGKQHALRNAATKGHLQMVKWLVNSDYVYWERPAVCAAAENGHFQVVKWLIEHVKMNPDGAFELAIENGHLEIAKYLHARGLSTCTTRTMFMAAKNGYLSTVQWLYGVFANEPKVDFFKSWSAKRDETKMTAMDAAASNGHLPVLELLRKVALTMEAEVEASVSASVGSKRKRKPNGKGVNGKLIPKCTAPAVQSAIAGGHLEVVLWLRQHYKLEPATNAIDAAAGNGHLEMVKWLHENTNCGCTTKAMDSAASGGHLAVVKWLHENRSEGCTTDAMDEAARNGHLDVVRWLNENRSEGCTTWAMDRAALRGDFDILLYLHYRRTEGCSYRDKYAAGNIVFWAFDNLPEFCFHF